MSACTGVFTSDVKNPASAIPVNATSHGAGIARTQSDAISSVNAAAPSVSASTLRTIVIETNAPTSAPPPIAPKSQPRTRGFAW